MEKGPEDGREGKGAAWKFLGAVLVSLGLINILLSVRTDASPDLFYFIMAAVGGLLLAAGAWRSTRS